MSFSEKFLKILKESSLEQQSVIQMSASEEDLSKGYEPTPDKINLETLGLEDFEVKTDAEYWNEVDPATEQRYVIPMLEPTAINYQLEYIEYMKLKHRDEKQFLKILDWE